MQEAASRLTPGVVSALSFHPPLPISEEMNTHRPTYPEAALQSTRV